MLGAMLLTTVNLAYYQELMADVRAAISAQRFGVYRVEVRDGWERGDLAPV